MKTVCGTPGYCGMCQSLVFFLASLFFFSRRSAVLVSLSVWNSMNKWLCYCFCRIHWGYIISPPDSTLSISFSTSDSSLSSSFFLPLSLSRSLFLSLFLHLSVLSSSWDTAGMCIRTWSWHVVCGSHHVHPVSSEDSPHLNAPTDDGTYSQAIHAVWNWHWHLWASVCIQSSHITHSLFLPHEEVRTQLQPNVFSVAKSMIIITKVTLTSVQSIMKKKHNVKFLFVHFNPHIILICPLLVGHPLGLLSGRYTDSCAVFKGSTLWTVLWRFPSVNDRFG